MLIDATYGRKTASIFIMDSDHVIYRRCRRSGSARRSKRKRDHEEEKRLLFPAHPA